MKVDRGRARIGRFKTGEDLLGSLTELCETNKIRLAVFSVIGALKDARLGITIRAPNVIWNARRWIKNLKLPHVWGMSRSKTRRSLFTLM